MNEETALDRLKNGVRRYQAEIHAKNSAMYHQVSISPQKPHALIIACADSRIHVEAITRSNPGDVFVARNIGNMVPAYGETVGEVSAVIEYAVSALKVRHVVVCGHSDCGAMKALLNPDLTKGMPAVARWLTNGCAALDIADSAAEPGQSPEERLRRVTEENVIMQLAHLKTHPSVAREIAQGQLSVSGWVYEIGTGEIRIAENGALPFMTLEKAGDL